MATEASDTAGAQAPPEAEKTEKRGSLKTLAAVAVSLFTVGFLISYLFLQQESAESEAHDDAAPAEHGAEHTTHAHAADAAQALAAVAGAELKRADHLFEEARWDLALAIYQQMSGGKAGRSDLVNLKTGACLERLGRWEEAVSAYRQVVSQGQKQLRDWALVAEARVLMRLDSPGAAKNLLASFLLRSHGTAAELRADACYLLGLALSHEALPRSPAQPLEDKVVRPPLGFPRSPNLPDGAEAAQPEAKETVHASKAPVATRLVPPEQKKLTLATQEIPVKEAIDELAKVGGLKIKWSPRAIQLVAGRTTRLDFVDLYLMEVVQAVAGQVGVLAKITDGTLELADPEETTKEELVAQRLTVAENALRGALRAYPGQAWSATAYLELGAIEEARGDLLAAQRWSERLMRDWSRSALFGAASYNAGILCKRRSQAALAVRAFYRVADHGPGHELAAPALLHVGCLYLSQGEFRQALPPLRRAVATAVGSDSLPAAAATLAAAYLALGQTRDANAVLLKHRTRLTAPRYRPSAAFLDAYALYLTAIARKETRREAVGLVTALLAVRQEMILGDFGTYLIGKAFRDLGMWDEVVRSYEKLARPSANPLVRETTLYLAEAYYALKKPERSIPLLTALADRRKDAWAAAARLQLAAIALQENRPRDCLQSCAWVAQEAPSVNREMLLHLMGEAYERIGEHEKAARCFAGRMP